MRIRRCTHPARLRSMPRGVRVPSLPRGELVAALVCGSKADGELCTPDESDALLALAHGVGAALDTLLSRGDSAVQSARETQALIVEKLDALMNQVRRALPPSVQ